MSLLRKLFGSRNDRLIRKLSKTVQQINQFEPALQALSDEALQQKTAEFRSRYQNGTTLEALLPEAFAVVREASRRVLKMRHFDVQLIGGMILHAGKISEMRTGEGKTLMATLAAYLNALTDHSVHIVTVNDYLAKRDANWMRPLYDFLGMSIGIVTHELSLAEKKQAYACDIVYATNNELGFDYLRDNMTYNLADKMQRYLSFAIVDEVDSILIDEARTPLIISGPTEESSALYLQINPLIPELKKRETEEGAGDYYLDEKAKQAFLTEEGHQHIEELLIQHNLLAEGDSLYASSNIILMHHVNAALRAHTLYQRNVEYIVRDNQIMIIDEHTGRALPGRRWSEGLHQAVEAKEGVTIENENQTLASITFQNYFRLYDKLAGMTGTADTEAYEFQQIYGLEVVVVPTNKPMIRNDYPDFVYLHAKDKYQAIIEDIKESIQRGQPVLVGTASIEASEYLSQLMNEANIPHQVLNAKFHDKEAEIIAQAGRPSAVTIATNMAGRGTDIVLGGNLAAELAELSADVHDREAHELQIRKDWQARHEQVLNAGGLYIIGSERHESRRIDNQLRGRAGRQGDPGSTRFYLSLEDNLIRIFASDRMAILMQRFGMQEGVALESNMLSRAIEGAQSKVEARNFEIRKQLLEYDDVANQQRKVIYEQRNALLSSQNISEMIKEIRLNVFTELFHQYVPAESLEEQWNIADLTEQLQKEFGLDLSLQNWLDADNALDTEKLLQRIIAEAEAIYAAKESRAGESLFRQFEKAVMLQCLDSQWKEHLAAMDYLRQGIHLRGYAQKNPKQEYKRESFELFSQLLTRIQYETVSILYRAEVPDQEEQLQMLAEHAPKESSMQFQHNAMLQLEPVSELMDDSTEIMQEYSASSEKMTPIRQQSKVGRNEPCPCGSGKKYKQCHGNLVG